MPRTKWAVLIIALCLIGFFSRITQQQKHRHHRHHLPALRQAAFSRHASSRCRGTRLRWCGPYYHQKPQPVKLGPAFDKPCPNQCSGVGVCNAMTGLCDCPAGWAGDDCSMQQKRPCSAGGSKYAGPGTTPMSHIGPDKRDVNWTAGSWTASRCGGICDDDRAVCFCDDPVSGRVPAAADAPPGAPPVRPGRPLPDHCQPKQDREGHPLVWGSVPYENLYGKSGWCTVPVGVEPVHRCGCDVDGTDGGWCELVTEQFCINSCSGHGSCQFGFCKCDEGWFGHDCAGRISGQAAEGALTGDTKALQERPWLKKGALVPPSGTLQPPSTTSRRRPFIFVYDIPAYAAARMLQYRGPKTACVWRFFDGYNQSVINGGWTYPLETLLHEMLLQSPHRTLDPEEADFFYVPAYTSCFMWPVHGWADYPWWYSDGGPRVMHMANMLLELKNHIQQTYPYWNRTQGRDHIWLATHDEGACWFPTEIYRHSIILTHWGRLDRNHTSNSAYPPDNYNTPHVDRGSELGKKKLPWFEIIKGHACYTPGKDLVIPLPKFPAHFRWSPLLGAPPQKRTTLLYFRGDVGKHRLPNYSRGIRQRLYNLTVTRKWTQDFQVRIGDRSDVPGEYSLGLASSKYCLVAPGDGWSPRAEDAILHGCIPVVVMDQVHGVFESIIDWDAFSVRVTEQQVEYMPYILMSISPDRLARMQAKLRRVWHRFAYFSQPLIRSDALGVKNHWKQEQQQAPGGNATQQDAWDAQLEALDEEWLEAQEAILDRQGFYQGGRAGGGSAGSSSSSRSGGGGVSRGDRPGAGDGGGGGYGSGDSSSSESSSGDESSSSSKSSRKKHSRRGGGKSSDNAGSTDGSQGSGNSVASSSSSSTSSDSSGSRSNSSPAAEVDYDGSVAAVDGPGGQPVEAVEEQQTAADRRNLLQADDDRGGDNADDDDGRDSGDSNASSDAGNGSQQQQQQQQQQQPIFKDWAFTDEQVEDDAFGTLMQWLYAKLLRRHNVQLHAEDTHQPHHMVDLAAAMAAAPAAAAAAATSSSAAGGLPGQAA